MLNISLKSMKSNENLAQAMNQDKQFKQFNRFA